MTRRELILRAGRAGGYSAAFVAMRSMGLLAEPPPGVRAASTSLRYRQGHEGRDHRRRHRRAGGGIRAAQGRLRLHGARGEAAPGGRNWSVSGGDKVEFTDGTAQQCAFDQGLYLNAGPGRIPSIHRTILGYCRELGVEMEVEVNSTRSALVQNDHMFDKRPIEQRQAINDMRGHVAELLAKAVRQGALDQEITARDKERMVAFLRGFGDLGADYRYTGSTRAGVSRFAGAADAEDQGRAAAAAGRAARRRLLAGPAARGAPRHAGGDAAADRRHGSHRLRLRPPARRHRQVRLPGRGDSQDDRRRPRRLRRGRRRAG